MMDRLRNWWRHGGWSALLELALIAALGVTLAHWTWVVLAPRTVGVSALAESSAGARSAPSIRRNLFGAAQEDQGSPASGSPASDIKLLGVLSQGRAGAGRAIFAVEAGKAKSVQAGAQVAPGLVLKEVHADHVLVSRSGVVERIMLDRRAAAKH